jgi:hypothetical protein
VNGLEERRPARVDVARGGEPQPALERGAQVGQDVSEHVVRHDDVEGARIEDHLHGERVHEHVRGIARRKFRGDLEKHAVPEVAHEAMDVVLVGHEDAWASAEAAWLVPRFRGLEGVTADPLDSLAGRQVLFERGLVRRAALEGASHAEIGALGVFTVDDEVDVLRSVPLERRQGVRKAPHRPVVDVEVQPEAQAEENLLGMPVVGHARVAEGAREDRVEVPLEKPERRLGNRLARREKMVRSPGKRGQGALDGPTGPQRLQHSHGLAGRLHADAVAGDDRDPEPSHASTASRAARSSPPSVYRSGRWRASDFIRTVTSASDRKRA